MSQRLTFEKILESQTAAELKEILKDAGIKGYSKMKKPEMVAHITKLALDEKLAEKKFLLATDSEIEDLLEAAENALVIDEESLRFSYWENICFAFIMKDNQVNIPNEVTDLYKKISEEKEYKVQRNKKALFVKYAMAAANLYGVISVSQLTEIINSFEEFEVTEEELMMIYSWREVLRGAQIFGYQDGYVMDELYDENILGIQKNYKELLRQQASKPFYIPSKEEFLNYAETKYVEKNKQYVAMRLFLLTEMEREEDKVEDICDEIQLMVRNGAQNQQIFDAMAEKKVIFPDDQRIKKFINLLMDSYNNARLRENRGFTPLEIEKEHAGNSVYSDETFEQIRDLNDISQQIKSKAKPIKYEDKKIYPNDPCPCGSGKKYKKCCGK